MIREIINVSTGSSVSFSEIDDIICKFFKRMPSNVQFSEEYHMMIDIVEVIYSSGEWCEDTFENIMARFDTIVANKRYLNIFRKCMIEVFRDKFCVYV